MSREENVREEKQKGQTDQEVSQHRYGLRVTADLWKRIDDYRWSHRHSSINQAIVELIEKGLDHS